MREAIRRAPATMAICGCWVAVYLGMVVSQPGADLFYGRFNDLTLLRFGAYRPVDLLTGQVWHALTATFLHGNLLHLALNLVGMYQLGLLLEQWYRPGQMLLIYAIIGFFGNIASGLMRGLLLLAFPTSMWLRRQAVIYGLGGSVVVVGLVALLAVVGWRSRTRYGSFVKAEMIGILAFTAFLGLILPVIDNFGHLGGAILGAVVGFFHRLLVRNAERRRIGQIAGLIGLAMVLACVMAQLWHQPLIVGSAPARPLPGQRPPIQAPPARNQRRPAPRVKGAFLDGSFPIPDGGERNAC